MKYFKTKIIPILTVCMMVSLFIVPTKVSAAEYTEAEDFDTYAIETLDDFYENQTFDFFDSDGQWINDKILEYKDRYFSDKEKYAEEIFSMISSQQKVEDMPTLEPLSVIPDVGGGGGGVTATKTITKKVTAYFYHESAAHDYGRVKIELTSTIKVAENVVWMDPNPSVKCTGEIFEKYKDKCQNYQANYNNIGDICYGGCQVASGVPHYQVSFRLSIYGVTGYGSLIKVNNALCYYNVRVYAHNYQWFNNYTDYMASFN